MEMKEYEQLIADVKNFHGKEVAKSMERFVQEKGPLLTEEEFMEELGIQSSVDECEIVDGLMRVLQA
jgi:hypothetical protein